MVAKKKVTKKKSTARLNSLIVKLKKAKNEHLVAEKKEKEKKKIRNDLEEQVLKLLEKSGLDRVTASGLTVSVGSRTIVENVKWEALYKYIKTNNAFDLLQRRVSTEAVKERNASSKSKVLGVKLGELTRLNVSRSSR